MLLGPTVFMANFNQPWTIECVVTQADLADQVKLLLFTEDVTEYMF